MTDYEIQMADWWARCPTYTEKKDDLLSWVAYAERLIRSGKGDEEDLTLVRWWFEKPERTHAPDKFKPTKHGIDEYHCPDDILDAASGYRGSTPYWTIAARRFTS